MPESVVAKAQHNVDVCQILQNHDIPNMIWFEDALRCYNVPTGVFDFHLLVPDIELAADVLARQGWETPGPQSNDTYSPFNSVPEIPHSRMVPPGWNEWPEYDCSWIRTGGQPPPEKPRIVVLWSIPRAALPERVLSGESHIPPLPFLLGRLIDDLLDATDDTSYQRHISCQIGYLYDYTPELKDPLFRKQLPHRVQQYHLDTVAGLETGTLPVIAHERKVREELEAGHRNLQLCSVEYTEENFHMFF